MRPSPYLPKRSDEPALRLEANSALRQALAAEIGSVEQLKLYNRAWPYAIVAGREGKSSPPGALLLSYNTHLKLYEVIQAGSFLTLFHHTHQITEWLEREATEPGILYATIHGQYPGWVAEYVRTAEERARQTQLKADPSQYSIEDLGL